jgi:quinol monooxygenase YgiN
VPLEKPVVLYTEFTALPGLRNDVARLLERFTDEVLDEPGSVTFIAKRRRSSSSVFFTFEEYVDMAAFRAHLSYAHSIAFNRALRPLVVGGGPHVVLLDRLQSHNS